MKAYLFLQSVTRKAKCIAYFCRCSKSLGSNMRIERQIFFLIFLIYSVKAQEDSIFNALKFQGNLPLTFSKVHHFFRFPQREDKGVRIVPDFQAKETEQNLRENKDQLREAKKRFKC